MELLFKVKLVVDQNFERELFSRVYLECLVKLLKLIQKFKEECLSPEWYFIEFFASYAYLVGCDEIEYYHDRDGVVAKYWGQFNLFLI